MHFILQTYLLFVHTHSIQYVYFLITTIILFIPVMPLSGYSSSLQQINQSFREEDVQHICESSLSLVWSFWSVLFMTEHKGDCKVTDILISTLNHNLDDMFDQIFFVWVSVMFGNKKNNHSSSSRHRFAKCQISIKKMSSHRCLNKTYEPLGFSWVIFWTFNSLFM